MTTGDVAAREKEGANPTAQLEGLLHAILTCVTAGPGLGFNRAVLFLADDERRELVAAMALGPTTPDEATKTWATLARERRSLPELVQGPQPEPPDGLQALLKGLRIPLVPPQGTDTPTVHPLLEAYWQRQVVKIANGAALGDASPRLREIFVGTELVCVPLLAKDQAIGLIVADNAFTRQPIDDTRVRLLELLALLAGLALDNARMYAEVDRQAAELRQTLDRLRETQEQLLHSERLATIGAVVARVSHEIRNPLVTIGGFARSLVEQPDDRQRVRRNAHIMADEVTRLELLLKEMLDLTSPRAPKLLPTDLNRLIAAFVELHRSELQQKGVALSLDLADGLPLIAADEHQLQRVLLNLWRNALDALADSRQAGKAELVISTRTTSAGVTLVFRDTGNGMSPQVRAKMFTPFFTTKPLGTGLGLAVVKKIIDDHEGRLDIDSHVAGGTTIRISLPVAH